ncbi:MAG: hypothetical protein ACK45B_14165, partial [Limisphaerales bacterium]
TNGCTASRDTVAFSKFAGLARTKINRFKKTADVQRSHYDKDIENEKGAHVERRICGDSWFPDCHAGTGHTCPCYLRS